MANDDEKIHSPNVELSIRNSADIMVVKVLLAVMIGEEAKRKGSPTQAREFVERLRRLIKDNFAERSDDEHRVEAQFDRRMARTVDSILDSIVIGK